MPRRSSGLFDLGNMKNVVSVILVANAFIWYYIVGSLLQSVVADVLLWAPIHFSALIVSAFAGAFFAKQMERTKILILWMIMGVVSSVMLFGLASTSAIVVSFVSFLLGLSLGFGMPACMSYFTDCVPVESRGRISGVTMLASGIGIIAFGFTARTQVGDLLLIGIVLGMWRLFSLGVFLRVKDARKNERKMSSSSFKRVFTQHSFILYFVPWTMFSLVNYLAVPNASNNEYLARLLGYVQLGFMGSSAVLGGIFADSVGRKRVAIAGFVMLGLSAAILGFSGNVFLQNEIPDAIFYFVAAVNGVAWGFLLVLFVLTLWGDLSQNSSSDKNYALGVMPFFFAKFLELIIGPKIPTDLKSSSPLFSFAAFFLFLAVLPLFYAPETLPENVMKKRELTLYVEKAQEIAQEYP